MKAISLTQPWATLIAIGAKQWETRCWATRHVGEVAIHAARYFTASDRRLAENPRHFAPSLARAPRPPFQDCGRIIAVAEIIACYPTSRLPWALSEEELAFGDYGHGRYAFQLENVRALPKPIDCRGALNIWQVPDEVTLAIEAQLKAVA